MIQEDYRAAIDVGTTKVVTVIGRERPDGSVEIAGVGVSPCNGLSKGMVRDDAATTQAIKSSIAEASKQAGVSIKSAYVGLSGSHIESSNRWDQVHDNPAESVITQEVLDASMATVHDMASDSGGKLLHVIPRGYALDNRHLVRMPIGMHAREIHAHTHVVKGDEASIERLRAAAESAGIHVADLIVEPIASAEAALTSTERDDGVVLLDIGGGTTDIAVFVGGQIVHSAVLPVGGWQFTNDLVTAFMTSFEEAEEIKCGSGSVTPEVASMREELFINSLADSVEGPIAVTKRELGQLLKERAHELFRLVKGKLATPHLANVPIDRVVLTGGGAKLDGMQALARYVFQGRVRTSGPRPLVGLDEQYQDPAYSAGIGMLIWGLRNLPSGSHLGVSTVNGAEVLGGGNRWYDAFTGWRKRGERSGNETRTGVSV
ncbi:MAG: cell division protein FtsA [Chloroflexi bacterium]|jgi:cell division protein FtsA|nr:cell division protein FtsA [Chloroflexota bacterium]MBT5318512.1 cell division protein FtsA [Chloroflexota bacterium]MBT6681921.1 cell division protein FtsA [Chloroflexota bacterium]